jgi:hypothetical protein
MEDTCIFCPAMAVPMTVKMPEPMTAPIPSDVKLSQPKDFFSLISAFSESDRSWSILLHRKRCEAKRALRSHPGAWGSWTQPDTEKGMTGFQCIAIWRGAQPDRGNCGHRGSGTRVGSVVAAGVYNCDVFELKEEIRGETTAILVASFVRGLRTSWGATK